MRKLITHAFRTSRFYRTLYSKHGINERNIGNVTLKDLPFIDKKMIMDNLDDVFCNTALHKDDIEKFVYNPAHIGRKYKNSYQVIHTSGSTGEKALFLYGPNDWAILKAIALTRITKNRINILSKINLVSFSKNDGHFAGVSLPRDAPKMFFTFTPLSIHASLPNIRRTLNRMSVDSISGYATGIFQLALEQLDGQINIRPKRIICSGETLVSSMANTIKKAFGVAPVNVYAASESVGIGAECDLHKGIHLFTDWHCIEAIDGKYRPVDPGVPGSVVLTNLYNYTQPVIRYKMHDEVIIGTELCSCGWPFPLLEKIVGRKEEMLRFVNRDGEKEFIHPLAFNEILFAQGVKRLQICQIDSAFLLIKVAVEKREENTANSIIEKIEGMLKEKKLDKIVQFRLQFVDEIARDSVTGKYRLFVPLGE